MSLRTPEQVEEDKQAIREAMDTASIIILSVCSIFFIIGLITTCVCVLAP